MTYPLINIEYQTEKKADSTPKNKPNHSEAHIEITKI